MKHLVLVLSSLLLPSTVLAHGFGQRIDLPLPIHLYLIGAGLTVAVSFVIIGFYHPRGKTSGGFELLEIPWIRIVASSGILRSALKIFFVLTFALVVASGLFGRQSSAFNIASTAVWILFGVGMVYVSAFLGNLWALANPVKTLFEWTEKLAGGDFSLGLPWPSWLAAWPAFVGFFAFRWMENVHPDAALPNTVAILVLLYAFISFAGMTLFGKERWLKDGDPFSVFFGFLSRFAPLVGKGDGQGELASLRLRLPGSGLLEEGKGMDVSRMAFVLFMLSSVAFDGVIATPVWQNLSTGLFAFGLSSMAVKTLGLAGLLAVFAAAYLLVSVFVRLVARGRTSVLELAAVFVLSLLPIAIAYEVAHYVTLLALEGQRTIALVSDPFGFGWDLFGTASYSVNYAAVNLKTLWHVQVGLIVTGHVVAVLISHLLGIRLFGDRKAAQRSQYPMLVLMVLYTILSLWIIAQPIVVGVE